MFSKFSVKKPYTVFVGVILVIVLGVVSLTRMTTDLLPDMNLPYAIVITTDVGASPEEVEADVSAPIEAAMATTSNIKTVSSSSYNNYSMVILEYEQSANMDSVLIEMQQKLDQLEGSWPESVGNPMIMQIDPDMMPVMVASADVDGLDQAKISSYVQNELVPALESVEGVASVSATGVLEESVEVTMDQKKIDELNRLILEKIEDQFTDAQAELDQGAAEVKNGKARLENGKAELADQLSAAQNEVINGKIQAFVGESDLKQNLTLLNMSKSVMEQVIPALQKLYNDGLELQKQIDALLAVSDQILNPEPEQNQGQIQMPGLGQIQIPGLGQGTGENQGSDQNQGSGQVQIPQEDAVKKQLEALMKQLSALNQAVIEKGEELSELGISLGTFEDIPKVIAELSSKLTEINTGIATIQSAQTQITDGKTSLDDALVTLNKTQISSLLEMSEASAKLADAENQITQGQAQLDAAKDSAKDSADLNSILTVDTLGNLLTAQNFSMPAGYVGEKEERYMVRVGDKIGSIDALFDVVLLDMGMEGIDPIRLSDVADVEMADNSRETYARVNGNPAIMLSIEKQTGYSTGDVTNRVKDKFAALEREDESLHMTILMNQGIYIEIIVQSVLENMIFGAILAVIVLILFLKDIKPTLVIGCSIPLSVIFAIVLMYFSNISLNIISLSGLALGIGMLVDNSIVVIENIYRLRNEGYTIRKAAVEGAGQVTGAIIASTLTTVCVFAPIVFTEGITRQLFVDIALTIAFTLTASLVVALTFVPMMAAGVLKNTKEIKHNLFEKVLNVYGRFLSIALRFKPVVFILVAVLLAVSAKAAFSRGFTFMDMDMETDQLTVTVQPKEDEKLTFEELAALSDEVVAKLSGIDGIKTIGAMAGGSGAMMSMGGDSSDSVTMYLILDEESKVTGSEVIARVKELTKDMDCEVSTDSSASDMSSFFGSGLSVQISGSDLEKLQELAKQVAEIVEGMEGTVDVQDGLDDTTPSFAVRVDKEKAAEYGMTTAQVFQLVYAKMASSDSPTTISTDLKDYEVYVRSGGQAKVTLDDIKNMTFTHKDREGNETEVPLRDIADFEEGNELNSINRDSQTRYISVSAGVDEDHNVTLLSSELSKELQNIELPEGYTIEMAGEDEMINDAMQQLYLMMLLAVVFIYLIMVAQFQSFLSPFIIMFTIPLAFTGGLFALYFTKNEVSVVAMIGFVMLAGIIVNNGIVMVDYINQLRKEGMPKREAVLTSAKTRLRPILMTALTTILAMFTMAAGIGSGSEMMQPMAIVTEGGLIYGTLLTLVVVPCIYDAFHRDKSMVEEEL